MLHSWPNTLRSQPPLGSYCRTYSVHSAVSLDLRSPASGVENHSTRPGLVRHGGAASNAMIRSLDAQPAQHRVVWGLRSSADWRLEAGCIGSCQSPPAMAARQVGAMQALRRRPRPGQGPPKAPLQVRWRAVIGTGRHAFGFTWDHKTGWHTSSRQAAQSLPLGPACAPTSAASTSLCARLRPERSSAIHLPVGSILCSSCGVFCSISQRLHHSTFPPL